MKIGNILNGWRNNLIPPKKLKEIIQKVQKDRLNICLYCENNSSKGEIKMLSTCNNCGCVLKAKTACMEEQCPIGKWSAMATEEESEQIKEQLKEDGYED